MEDPLAALEPLTFGQPVVMAISTSCRICLASRTQSRGGGGLLWPSCRTWCRLQGRNAFPTCLLNGAHPSIPQKERRSYSSRLEARAWGQPSQRSQSRPTQDRTWEGREALAQLTFPPRPGPWPAPFLLQPQRESPTLSRRSSGLSGGSDRWVFSSSSLPGK